MKILIFTKDRPLQCQAAIESFLFYSDFQSCYDYKDIYVICHTIDENYSKIKEKYDKFNWIEEISSGGFDAVYRDLINSFDLNENILCICDDQIFVRHYSIKQAEDYLNTNPKLIGFSLRLGLNIDPLPQLILTEEISPFVNWHWPSSPSHYGYPIEWMHTLYKCSLLQRLNSENKNPIKCPNFSESFGTQYACKNLREEFPYMAMFRDFNYTYAQDVNACQQYFLNKVQGNDQHDLNYLKELYESGFRLDWSNVSNVIERDLFIGAKYWRVFKDQNANTR